MAATTTKITATSRVAVKIKDNYYTVEYSEERALTPDMSDAEVEGARRKLFDDVNAIVDDQANEIIQTFRK